MDNTQGLHIILYIYIYIYANVAMCTPANSERQLLRLVQLVQPWFSPFRFWLLSLLSAPLHLSGRTR